MIPNADIPHHTVTPGKFTCCLSAKRGFTGIQCVELWWLMKPFNLKDAPSLHTILFGIPIAYAHFAR